MKTICGWIGWVIGMFLGFAVGNSVPFLGFVFIIVGIPLGRYIGGQIEESREQERNRQEEYARQKAIGDFKRQRDIEDFKRQRDIDEKRAKAIVLANKYPKAMRRLFMRRWGIQRILIEEKDLST